MAQTHQSPSREFNRYDREYLRGVLKRTQSARVYRRARAVLEIANGSSVSEAARIAGISRQSASSWLQNYLEERRSCAFTELKRQGRPLIELPLSRTQLLQLLKQPPMDLGYMSNGWTVALLRQHFKQHYGICLSDETLRRRLRQLGHRWKRPRYIFTEPDPNRAQKKGASCDA